MKTFIKTLVVACSMIAAAGATAGNFEVWTQTTASGSIAMVSFTGDGTTQEAQLDLSYPKGLKVVGQAKVAGSICGVFADRQMLRIVPPSGAGVPLSGSAVDYCSFVFTGKSVAPLGKGSLTKIRSNCTPAKACGLAIESAE